VTWQQKKEELEIYERRVLWTFSEKEEEMKIFI
jgi:hypothetical protein